MPMYRKLQRNFDTIEFLFKNASTDQLIWGKEKKTGSLGQVICHLRDIEGRWVGLCMSHLRVMRGADAMTRYGGHILAASRRLPGMARLASSPRRLAANGGATPAYARAFEEFAQQRRQTLSLLQTLLAVPGRKASVGRLVEKIDRHDQAHIDQIEALIRHMPLNPLLARALHEISDYHRRYQRYLAQATSLLDIGLGTGLALQHVMQQNPHLAVAGIDIRDLRLPHVTVPLQLYNGDNLPFESQQFDVSLLFYVLHHCHDPARLLAEARRVTRQRLIIIEEFDLPGADKISLELTERQNHRALGLPTDLPYQLFDQTDFEVMLRQRQLWQVERQLLPSQTTRPVQKYLYVLDCGAGVY